MVSFAAYVALSTCLCVGHVAYVYATREQFYTTVQYLYTTNVSLTILGNFGLATVLLFGHLLKRFFFGTLRESEVERLYEQTWYAITETCLAITIFREELAVRFLVLLSVLLFVKTFHWLCEFRVEYIEQSPGVSRWTHVRVLSLLLVLLACDIGLAFSFLQRTLAEGPSVLLLFLFEFMILAVTNVSLIFKYLIILFDIARDNRWERKSILLFYLEIASEMLQLTLYLVFFLIIFKYYGIPLHIVRDLYMTFMKLRKRIADFIRYRRVTANLNERFPNATDVELEEASHVCIICREPMTGGKKLPCAHVFHMQCLRSWLERQQTCPICRAPVLEEEFTPEQRERARRREESLQAAARNRDQRDGAHSSDNPAARAESETPQNNAGPSHADTHTSEPAAMRVAGEAPLAAAGHGAAGGAVTSAASSSQASHLPVPSHDLALPPLGALDPEDQARVLQFHADMLQNYVSYYESLARDLQLRAAKKATTEVASGSEAPEAAARETHSAAVPASAESAEATPETRSAPAPHTAAAPASADSADAVVLDRSDSPRTQAELRRRRLEALEGRHRAAHAAPDDREGEADGARRSD